MCNHDIKDLIGTSEGIKCRACGKTFKTFAEIHGKKAEEKPEPVAEEEKDEAEEKPKKRGGRKAAK